MKRIKSLPENHIFVFGSNEGGRHGRGAALDAKHYFGAKWGVANGIQGRSYGIPTKDNSQRLKTLSIRKIKFYVDQFIEFAKNNPQLQFVLTPIGTGLAGIPADKIGPLFKDAPSNVIIPDEFKDYVK